VTLIARLRTRTAALVRSRIAGSDFESAHTRIFEAPGPRWFTPDDPIWRVHADASMFVGGIRALLLQSLHPRAMAAVSQHSGFRGDPWGRLQRTSAFLATVTYGTIPAAERMIAAINRIHAGIEGRTSDGIPYRASDPELLAWIHVAEVDSFLTTHDQFGASRLADPERDRYVAQAAETARRLGVIDPPTTEAELAETLAAYRPELRGTPEAREAIQYLLLRPELPPFARPPYLVLVAAAIGLMPRWTRWPLRLPWFPVSERTVVRALGSVATGTIRWAMTPGRDERSSRRA
jgi:uncharacterized protein (DUF2236 family)